MKKRKKNLSRTSNAEGKSNKCAHPLRKEILGLVFLLIAIIFAGSLLSYYPGDRLFWNVTGPVGKAHNLFGTAGSHLAGALFGLIGFSGFWLPLLLLAISFISFRGRPLSSPLVTTVAFLALLASFAAILNLQFAGGLTFRGGRMPAGGLVGLHLAGLIRAVLNHFGAYVFLVTVFIISLMVVTHLSLGRIFWRVGLWILGILKRFRDIVIKIKERRKRVRKTMVAHHKIKSRPKVTIVKPDPESGKSPQQERFPFMHVAGEFKLPPLDLLRDPPERKNIKIQRESLEMNARRLERKLSDFGVDGEVIEILPGPVITMYEYKPAPGIKISKVANLSDDLALTLRAQSIRIVAPIPGKAAIGIEIPNNQREGVYLKEILSSPAYINTKFKLPIALGKDITGAAVVTDLSKMPHLLVAGATGTGKSVSINTMIQSLLFKVSPEMARFLLVDPKRIELSTYHDIPHLLHPVVTQPKDATKALRWAVDEMERRYMLLSDRGVRNIETYNRKIVGEVKASQADVSKGIDRTLPYIIVIIDELADLMMISSKEVEEAITRLAQMARAAGIHLIIATQRPSVNVLTGIIKANFPTRLSFQVSSKVDSRTILDTNGAEHLLGDGDMLFMPPGVGRIMRIHGAYVSEEEVKAVTDFLRQQKKPDYDATILSHIANEEECEKEEMELDEKYEEAIQVVSKTGQASISMLQRKLRVGYNRAARMIEVMEKEGIVGPSDGVRPRDVYGRKVT
ncbi:MAG: DNA translocase FtsK [Desulfobacteraceae bacterium]|nr:DNA translocase FtsK [Desulfobacterales bacterium]MBL6967957.1 DNA translocase FtsK [Desulfobacteraceae bacterium]MBL7102180.1 DNA translocase FtsK [Desulfobacteraceae bacterium]MBL7172044.1 DNA translocase FtsK [Desulfobacteraceae bacterium]